MFRRFVGVFARPEHPLVLFLDDLQWLDRATLDLVQHLLAHQEMRQMMVVGAYRDNEVDSDHPLTAALNEIRSAGTPVHEILLSPLRLDDVGQLIAEALRGAEERTRPLARLIHDKAGGNPFFTIQFLAELAEENLLASITMRQRGPGTCRASTRRVTPTTSLISWAASSAACPRRARRL